MVKAPAAPLSPQQNQIQIHYCPTSRHPYSLGIFKYRSVLMANEPSGGTAARFFTTKMDGDQPDKLVTSIAIVAPTTRPPPTSAAQNVGAGQSGCKNVNQQPPPQLQQRMHHIHHHHPIATIATNTIPTIQTAGPTTWPIVEPVFHFGPGFEPHTRPYCPTHSQGSQPSEHVVLFHIHSGVSVTFQTAGKRDIIRGPVTVPMISNGGSPPIAMPVQVPPGHLMQQIVDENGTLRHVILSTQPGQGGVQPHIHGHYIANGTSHPFFPLTPGPDFHATYPPGGPPHFHPGTIPPGGTLHTPQQMPHSPSPPHNNNYHKDERTQRQYSKLQRKLELKQRDFNTTLTNTVNSPRKNLEINGSLRRNSSQQHGPRNGASSVGTSEDGEESSVPDEEDDSQVIIEILSSVQAPQISEVTSRSALLQWSPPSTRLTPSSTTTATSQAPNETLPFNVRDLQYEVLLSDRGKENKYKSIFKGPSLSCKIQDLRPGQEYSVCLKVHLDELQGSNTDPATFTTPACEPDSPAPPKLLARTKNSLQLRWNAPADNGAHITNYILEFDNGKYGGNLSMINPHNCDFTEAAKTKGKQFTVQKLHPSTFYVFRLYAINDKGKSGYSDLVKYYTAGNPPPQPDQPSLTACTSNSLRLAWQRKTHDEEYVLQMNELEYGYGFRNMYTGPSNVYECTDLRRATKFQFRVRADNESGSSSWSEEVTYATRPECPNRPSKPQVKGKIHAHHFKVKWDPPNDTGGAEIIRYHLEINSGSAFEQIYSGKDSEAGVERLSPGTTYQLRVLCEGPGGISGYSEPCTVTTEPVSPNAPTRPFCPSAPSPYAAVLKWEKPDYNGGSPVLEYEMEVEKNKIRNSVYKGKEMFCVVNDLLPGELYTVQVRAINRIGAGPWSEEYSFNAGATAPNPPSSINVNTKSPTHLSVIWNEPHCNGAQITEYTLESSMTEDQQLFQIVYRGQNTTADVKNLTPFTIYHFRICATNSAGKSPYSHVITQKTPPAAPNVPVLGDYEITAKTILISWTTPECNGSDIKHYNIECGDRFLTVEKSRCVVPVEEISTVEDESSAADREDDYDDDDDSDSDEHDDEDEVDNVVDACKETTNLLESSNINNQNNNCNSDNSNKNEFLIDDLQPETTYRLRIQAVNEIGTGPFTNYIKFTTAPLPPKPPKLECVQFGFSHLKLRWAETGKSLDLTRYYVEMQNKRSGEYQNVYTGNRATCKVTKLHELTAYTFRICVETKHAGMGDYSEDFIFMTIAAMPNSVKAPRMYMESSHASNHSPQHPNLNGLANLSTGTTTVQTATSGSSNQLTIEWQSSRNNPFSDPIEYVLQFGKTKDQEFHEIYRGPETRYTVHNLDYGIGYSFKVCPVRVRSNGEQILGQFSPVLHHQLTYTKIGPGSSSHHHGHHSHHHGSSHRTSSGIDEVDARTAYEVNSKGELVLNPNYAHGGVAVANPVNSDGSTVSSRSNSSFGFFIGGNKNSLVYKFIDRMSSLLEKDVSKAVLIVFVSFLVSIILAAIIQKI